MTVQRALESSYLYIPGLQTQVAASAFMGSGDWNLGPHVCTASILPTHGAIFPALSQYLLHGIHGVLNTHQSILEPAEPKGPKEAPEVIQGLGWGRVLKVQKETREQGER